MNETVKAILKAFDEAGIKGTTTILTEEQSKRFREGSEDLQKFLEAKRKHEEESKNCKMVFK